MTLKATSPKESIDDADRGSEGVTPTRETERPTVEKLATFSGRIRRGVSSALNLLYPPHCGCCGIDLPNQTDRVNVCAECLSQLTSTSGPACRRCGAPVPGGVTDGCVRCNKQRFHFDAVYCLGKYEAALRAAVLRMKEPSGEPLAADIGRLLADRWAAEIGEHQPDLAVCVPMHWRRRIRRGTNSPDIVMQGLGQRLCLPTVADLLKCRRNIQRQSSLPPGQRFLNVRGAYRVTSGYDIKGASVVLVDDILTTGATASQAARALRQSGADRVTVIVAARSIGPSR